MPKKDRQSNNLQTKIDTNETRNSGAGISLEEKFTPPNFMIRDFSVTPKKKTLDLEIIYLINEQLYATLEQNVNYYFQVALPGKIQRFTGADKTQIVQGQKVEKNRLDYSVKVKVKLKKAG
ncbi:hypothetical protein RWE15_05265 [Virgibacillus halophilus]|uniref:Uncharacterized protein n=1 Tax=Tigheibacillus halophilus TaxID=361280 RepID=A0ABU5C582_9BACI|nr:hypothetical protein [Virgibacillus halophilus]